MSKEKDLKVPQPRNGAKRPIEPYLLHPLSDLAKQTLLSQTSAKNGKRSTPKIDFSPSKKTRVARFYEALTGFKIESSLDIQNLINDKPVEIFVDAKVSPTKLKGILNAFGTYYRACGGDGLTVTAEFDDFSKVK